MKKEMNEANSKVGEPTTISKIVKTFFLVFTWVCIGLCLEIQGPTFKDLKILTNGSTEEISRAISGRSLGFFAGAAIGGFLVDKLTRYCYLIIAVCVDLMGTMSVAAPWSPNTGVLWALFFLQGLFEGVINIAGQKLILEIWREKASSPLHLLHFGFGLGSFIVPNIANPFLAIPLVETASQNGTFNVTWVTERMSTSTLTTGNGNATTEIQKYIKETEVHWAYIIVAIIAAINSLAHYCYQFSSQKSSKNSSSKMETTKSNRSLREIIDPATCAGGQRIFGVVIFVLLFLFFFNATGGERLYGKFIRNFSIDRFHFSNDEGSLINTAFWISYSLGRFSGFVIAIWVPIRILLLIEVSGALITSVLLNIFAYDNSLMLWIFTQPMGYFIAPLFPSGLAWGDSYVEMTGLGITILMLGGGLGGMSYMWIIGHFYDDDHRSFLYLTVVYGGIVVFFAFIMTLVARGHSPRNVFEDTSIDVKKETSDDEKLTTRL